ncbi:MAG: DUF4185 domain-containing protein, partial [Gaiellaceae bacterium]
YGSPFSGQPCGDYSTVGGYTAGPNLALPGGVQWMFYWNTDSCLNRGTPQSPTALAKSTDQGVRWTPRVLQSWPDGADLWPIGFLQYGQAYAGALDGNAYIYLSKIGGMNRDTYLARVATGSIDRLASWQYYSGTNAAGDPTWSSTNTSAVPVFTDRNGNNSELVSAVFNRKIGRYVAVANHGTGGTIGVPAERQLGVFDAAAPWGPWTTVSYVEDFDNTGCGANCLGNGNALGMTIPQKWISSDGLGVTGVYSSDAGGPDAGYDSLNTIDGTLGLATGSFIKNVVNTDSGGNNVPVVTDRLSLSNPGNLEYIDSTARFTSIFSGYVGGEMIRLRNADKTNNRADYLTFTLTTATTVRVGWPSGVAVPAWLRSWTSVVNTLVGDRTFNVYKRSFPAGNVTLPGANNATANYIAFIDS